MPDAAIIRKIKNGDSGAFSEIVSRYSRPVYGIVSRMVDNREDVDDAVQEVFVSAYKSLHSFRGDSLFSTWIYRIGVNTAIRYMRRNKNKVTASIDDPESGLDRLAASNLPSPEDSAQRAERDAAIRKAISSLPEKHRVVVILHYLQDMSCDEIAALLDCSVGTVWSRLHYACKKMQHSLSWLANGA